MSLLKLKQIAGPVDSTAGSFVSFNGTTPVWSSALTTGIAIPSGTTAERPQTPTEGMIRFNTETNEVEAYSGTDWVSLQTANFTDLKDAPNSYTDQGGKLVRVNAAGTGLEFFTPEVGFTDKIQSADTTAFVETERSGFENKVVAGSDGVVVLEVEGDSTVTTGEKLAVNHEAGEVQLVARDTAGTADVDVRVIPQAGGHVYFGVTGDGIVESELTFDLYLKGGNNDATTAPGDLILSGGNAVSGNFSGGNLVLKPGEGFGTGIAGAVSVEDLFGTKIVDFTTSGSESSNWLEVRNGAANADPAINGVKISAALASSAASVDIYLDPKNDGLVRVSDYGTYSSSLVNSGNNDALVTKGYVLSLAGLGEGEENTIIAGTGLTDDNGTFNVNVGADTIAVDGVNNLIVSSSGTAGQILISAGTAGEQATWGALSLSDANSFTGVLNPANGGLGFSSFTQGDLLIGNAGGSLDKLAIGPAGQVLMSNGTTLTYTLNNTLYDANGEIALSTVAAVTPVNNVYVKNAATDVPVEIGAVGDDTDIDIMVVTKGAGQILAKTGYTAAIGSDPETIVTKKYVDDAIQGQAEPYMRWAALNADWASEMNIGTPTPTISGKQVYVYRAMVRVITPITGGGVTQARIMSGADVVMEFNENDVLAVGTYVAETIEAFSSTNTQLVLQFFQSDGTSQATPTAGSLEVSFYYRFR
ncbi:hypothetical protein D3C72_185170 [compost metagenome]